MPSPTDDGPVDGDPSVEGVPADPNREVENPPSPATGAAVGKSHRLAVIAIVGVLILAAVLLGLYFGGVFPGAPASKPRGAAPSYRVAFTQTGLPVGAGWSIELGGLRNQSSGAAIDFSLADGTYSYTIRPPTGFTPTPPSGRVTVAAEPVTIPIVFSAGNGGPGSPGTFTVEFLETGLPTGTDWSVTLGGDARSGPGPNLSFAAVNGSFPFTVGAVAGYPATPASGTIAVAGANVTQGIAFAAITGTEYPVTFSTTSPSAPAPWTVTVGGIAQSTSGTSLTFQESNGSYRYQLSIPAGWTVSPAGGAVSVMAGPAQVNLVFGPNGSSPSLGAVEFDQSGLPSNLSWGIAMALGTPAYAPSFGAESGGSNLALSVPLGSYQWHAIASNSSWLASPGGGVVDAASSPTVVKIHFALTRPAGKTYNLTVSERGLPSGELWQVWITNLDDGTTNSSFTTTPSALTFAATNGSYLVDALPYNGVKVPGLAPLVYPDSVSVNGAPAALTVPFGFVYLVTLNVTGLPTGAHWAITVTDGHGDQNFSSGTAGNSNSAPFLLENGTYHYQAICIGYTASPSSGSFSVQGTGPRLLLAFSIDPTYPLTFHEVGLPSGTFWYVALAVNGFPSGGAGFEGVWNGTGSSLTIPLPPGNYSWIDGTNTTLGWVATPASGGIDVTGPGSVVEVTFAHAPADRPVLFYQAWALLLGEDGSPNGSTWGVTIDGTIYTGSGEYLLAYVPNGSYDYQLIAPAGWLVTPASGTLTVNGHPGFGSWGGAVLVLFYTGAEPSPPPLGAAAPSPGGLSSEGLTIAHPPDPGPPASASARRR